MMIFFLFHSDSKNYFAEVKLKSDHTIELDNCFQKAVYARF